MSARTTRIRLFAASTVALAALSLTACEDGADLGSAAATSAPTATTEVSASPEAKPDAESDAQSGTDQDTGARKTDGSHASPNAGGAKKDDTSARTGTGTASDKPGKCSASDVRITATEVSRPVNHLLLTATNTGSSTCYLPAYPMARFGEAQAVPPVVADSQPQAVTTLAPGKSGYAGVLTSAGDGSGTGGYTAKTLTVPFDNGSIATVALPADGVYVDSSLKVTYWLTSMGEALSH
ncbi:DUF4232 domain-containing protein [Streptomyces sp. NPDC005876]|uniref:DUF4232 domain-containing protein n=1 Tax=Streptomyces sp. NPDC005876 TaxID=3157076 RepID=UPI00340CA637